MRNLIPVPASLIPGEGYFEFSEDSMIIVPPGEDEMLQMGKYLAEGLRRTTGLTLPVTSRGGVPSGRMLHLTTQGADPNLGTEGYILQVTPQAVQISGLQPAGVFYGVQTLLQLLSLEIDDGSARSKSWQIEAVMVRDWPRFAWRGTMLDVARHFFSVAEIKGYIDTLAAYKLNVLHLHLSDDQGWRIEVRSWPNLTAIGGETAVDGDPGGFYTQVEYAEMVEYARQRYITIVPEIDLPGHTNAVLASYPELNCDGRAPARYTGTEVGFSSLCVEKEITYQFINDVLQEVAALTPGAYLHIGGDEALATSKAAYVSFIERVASLVSAWGKRMVGWEEIAQCDLPATAIVQYWKDAAHAEMAVQKGMGVILSPATRTYLDMKYHPDTPLGLSWAGTTDVEKAYRWDPAGEVKGLDEQAILGVEAPLWTETTRTMKDVEFMAFPRLLDIAEIGWSPQDKRDWEDYRLRLAAHGQRLREMGIDFHPDPKIPWI